MNNSRGKNTSRFTLLFILLTIILLQEFSAQLKSDFNQPQNYNSSPIRYAKINVNNVSIIIQNNGIADATPGFFSGFQFPKGAGKICVT